jgi:hypothetical protein
VLLVRTEDYALTAYDASCAEREVGCQPLWTTPIDEPAAYTELRPVAADGFVYFSTQGRLLAYDLHCRDDGGVCGPAWSANVFSTTDPMVIADLVVTGAQDGLYAYPTSCAQTGGRCEPRWVAPLPQPVIALFPELKPGSIDVLAGGPLSGLPPSGFADVPLAKVVKGYEFLVDCATDGAVCSPVRRPFEADSPLVDDPLVDRVAYEHGRAYGTDGNRVFAVDDRCLRTDVPCDILWRGAVPSSIAKMRLADEMVYVTTNDARIFAVPTSCGGTVTCPPAWWGSLPAPSASGPVISGGMVFVPTAGEGIAAFAVDCRNDGGRCDPVWRASASGLLSTAVVTGRTVFVGTDDGYRSGALVAFGLDSETALTAGDGRWALVGWVGILGAGLLVLVRRFGRRRIR